MSSKRVYTIGYDARQFDEFIKLLKYYLCFVIVDVRRFPKSRFEIYSKKILSIALNDYGIDYVWLGEYLGGYRGGYQEYMKSQEYQLGIKRLSMIIDDMSYGHVCLMCMERIPWRCHRRFISSTLIQLGYEVYHIIDAGNIVKHTRIY